MDELTTITSPDGLGAAASFTTTVSTPTDALTPGIHLPPPAASGRLRAVLLPAYLPVTDLRWTDPPTDDPETLSDESTVMPTEHWLVQDRPYLVNCGGNRVGVVGEELLFDASFSQGDNDGLVTTASWDFGDGNLATGLQVTHVYMDPGLYTLSCHVGAQVGHRYVKILASLADGDLAVTSFELTASTDGGWAATVIAREDVPAIADGQGMLLYVDDSSDLSWRAIYDARIRALARGTAYTGTPPVGQNLLTGSSAVVPAIGDPSGSSWALINAYDEEILQAAVATGVLPNLIKAVIYIESGGEASLEVATGNPSCPVASGLFQIGCGCTEIECGLTILDPATNILVGAKQLAWNFSQCATWDGAILRYFSGSCALTGATDDNGVTDAAYLSLVKERWAEADAVTPSPPSVPTIGSVIFQGYVVETINQGDANTRQTTIQLQSPGKYLEILSRRREAFFETAPDSDVGGTMLGGPPMRIAHCIHHTLAEHTNFAERHDVILDWSGPRLTSTTANEGTMWGGFTAWAENDFARVWSTRQGALRYEPVPAYRGKSWYTQAKALAIQLDPRLVLGEVAVTELTVGHKVTWTKLCGLTSKANCELCGVYPCDGPRAGKDGEWVLKRGLQYDDAAVLCAMAAHHYAYLNRRYRLELNLAWRHDLEINDLLRLPLRNPDGRFDWRQNPPVFCIVGLTHHYDSPSATWVTSVQLEEVTYGIPCVCPTIPCPDLSPCPTCPPSNAGNCQGVDTTLATSWGTWTGTLTTASGDELYQQEYTAANDVPAINWDTRPVSVVDTQSASTGSGTVGTLVASLDDNTESQSGAASATYRNLLTRVSWADFRAVGETSITMSVTAKLTPRSSGPGSGHLYLFDLDGAPVGTDTVETIVPANADIPPFDYPTIDLGQVLGGQPFTFTLELRCAPAGRRYRLGLRCDDGLSEHQSITSHAITIHGTTVDHDTDFTTEGYASATWTNDYEDETGFLLPGVYENPELNTTSTVEQIQDLIITTVTTETSGYLEYGVSFSFGQCLGGEIPPEGPWPPMPDCVPTEGTLCAPHPEDWHAYERDIFGYEPGSDTYTLDMTGGFAVFPELPGDYFLGARENYWFAGAIRGEFPTEADVAELTNYLKVQCVGPTGTFRTGALHISFFYGTIDSADIYQAPIAANFPGIPSNSDALPDPGHLASLIAVDDYIASNPFKDPYYLPGAEIIGSFERGSGVVTGGIPIWTGPTLLTIDLALPNSPDGSWYVIGIRMRDPITPYDGGGSVNVWGFIEADVNFIWDDVCSFGNTPCPPEGGPGPIVGTCPGWPTAAAIDSRIAMSEQTNGRTSPLHNMGNTFISLGRQYGINPGVVCAILQRESQLGADGSYLPTQLNNFGGVTGDGPCGTRFYLDRNWAVYCSAAQGLEGVFQTLDGSLYRNTGGAFQNIMQIYSPPFENDWAAMWQIFTTVGSQLGISLGADTNIYAGADCVNTDPLIPAPSGPGYGGYTTMLEYALHQVGSTIAQGPYGSFSHSTCDCFDFGCPIGTPMYPIAPGIVIVSEPTSGVYTPNTVVVRTAWGDIRYGHFSQLNVTVGQQVTLSTLLGRSGSAGTGPHLHLGLEYGVSGSPAGLTLTQTLGAIGFNLGAFAWS